MLRSTVWVWVYVCVWSSRLSTTVQAYLCIYVYMYVRHQVLLQPCLYRGVFVHNVLSQLRAHIIHMFNVLWYVSVCVSVCVLLHVCVCVYVRLCVYVYVHSTPKFAKLFSSLARIHTHTSYSHAVVHTHSSQVCLYRCMHTREYVVYYLHTVLLTYTYMYVMHLHIILMCSIYTLYIWTCTLYCSIVHY